MAYVSAHDSPVRIYLLSVLQRSEQVFVSTTNDLRSVLRNYILSEKKTDTTHPLPSHGTVPTTIYLVP